MENYIKECKRVIQNSSRNNKLVIFVGAGISANSGLPTWGSIIDKIKKKIDISDKETDFKKIAQYYYNSRGQKEYYDFLISELNINVKPNEIHNKLLELNPYHIITTNYDELIEKQANQKGMFYDIVSKDNDLPYTPNNKMIIKMHGDFKNKNIVLKEDDYLSYSQNFKLIETYIKSIFSTHTILFVGYSLSDPDVQYIFQWIKDILEKDLPRPYFLKIDKDDEFDIDEYQYYKDKGINILYYSKLDKELRQKLEESSKEIKNELGKKTLSFIKYLLDEYESEFQIENLYEYVDEFEKINYIMDHEAIINFLKQKLGFQYYSDFEIKGNMLIFCNSKSDFLIEEIKKSIRIKSHDFSKIVDFLNKVEIKYIVKQNDKNLKGKRKIIYRNRKESEFLKTEKYLKILDYSKIEEFRNSIDNNEIKSDYKVSLEKAYAMYYIEDYYGAYKEYKKISSEALLDKEFMVYAISEFNRYYTGKLITSPFYKKEILQSIENEIQKIELNKILLKFPFKKEEYEFIRSILNWDFVTQATYNMINIKPKIDKDEVTCYFFIDPDNIGIYKFKAYVQNFWKFIKYNMLAVDEYTEIKNVFYNYIDCIMKNYITPKIYHNEEETLFGIASENEKIKELTLFELIVMLEYIRTKDLELILQRNRIKKINIKKEDAENFLLIIKKYIKFANNKRRYNTHVDINKIFLMLTVIELTKEQYEEVNKCIIEYWNTNRFQLDNYKYINKYIYYQNERFNNFELNTLVDILYKIIENLKTNQSIYDVQKRIINNITVYIKKNNKKYQLKNVVYKLIEPLTDDMYLILIILYKVLNTNDKKKVRRLTNNKLNDTEFSKIHCDIYYEMLMEKIINPSIIYENKYFNFMTGQMKEERSKIKNSGILKELLEKTSNLILNNYLIEKQRFGQFLKIEDTYDFLYEINSFPVNQFNIEWLLNYSDNLIKGISQNKKLKQEIKGQIGKKILSDEQINDKLLKIYVKYFT